MLTGIQLDRYADVLLWALKTARKGRFKPRDIILLRFDAPALALAEVLFDKIMAMGLHPVLRMQPTVAMEKSFYTRAAARQLVFTPPGEETLLGQLNGSIFLHAPESITHLSGIDPGKIGKAMISRKFLRDILDRRDEAGAFGWTLCTVPTEALAQHAQLSMAQYEKQLLRACFLDRRDPVAHWKSVFRNAARIKKWINGLAVDHYRIESAGTDLRITPGSHRRWIGLSGHNIPSFELFLSPDWRGTDGVYTADQPSFRSGNYVRGVRLEFKRGRVVGASAQSGEAFLERQLSMDPGAGRVGEFSLTDRRFSRIDRFMANTLFDENYGGRHGNCHIALGSSYADTYDGNPAELSADRKRQLGFNDSALHWDLVNTEPKRVVARLASGELMVIYENGKFAN